MIDLRSVNVCGITALSVSKSERKEHCAMKSVFLYLAKSTVESFKPYRWHLMSIVWVLILGGSAFYSVMTFQICPTLEASVTCLRLPSYAYTVVGHLVNLGILQRTMLGDSPQWYKVVLFGGPWAITLLAGLRNLLVFIRRRSR